MVLPLIIAAGAGFVAIWATSWLGKTSVARRVQTLTIGSWDPFKPFKSNDVPQLPQYGSSTATRTQTASEQRGTHPTDHAMLVSINNGSAPSGFRNLTASQGARAQFSMRIHSDTHPIHASVIVILAMILTYLYLVMKRRLAYPLDYPLDFRIRIVHEAAAVEPPPDAQQRDRTHRRNEDGARASSSGPHRRALASLDGSGDISTTSRRPDSGLCSLTTASSLLNALPAIDTLSRPAIPSPGPCNNGKFGGLGKSSLVSSGMGCEEKQSMTLLTVEIPVADLAHEFEEWQQ